MTDVAKAALSSAEENDLPDSAFAYIEPGGKKDSSGKTTPRSKRHFPINDAAHVRNALARLDDSPFGDKARPKVEAAAKKFGVKVSKAAAATAVIKASGRQRYTLGLAYPADRIDAHGEFMTAAELEQSAWAYVAKHRRVGFYHADGTEGHGTVVESYIYRGPDWQLPAADGSEVVVKAGDWLLGVQWDEPGWRLIEAGLAGVPGMPDGLSMQGRALRNPHPAAAPAA